MGCALPVEQRFSIGAFAHGHSCRSLCRDICSVDNRLWRHLRFRRGCPETVVERLIRNCYCLKSVKLTGLDCVTDELLRCILSTLSHRENPPVLDLSHCRRPSRSSLPLLRKYAGDWHATGCWRLWPPCSDLPANEIIRLQLLALRNSVLEGDDLEGIKYCFEFRSTLSWNSQDVQEFCHMIRYNFEPMQEFQFARMWKEQSPISPSKVAFCIAITCKDAQGYFYQEHWYRWRLSLQASATGDEKCWLTELMEPRGAASALELSSFGPEEYIGLGFD